MPPAGPSAAQAPAATALLLLAQQMSGGVPLIGHVQEEKIVREFEFEGLKCCALALERYSMCFRRVQRRMTIGVVTI